MDSDSFETQFSKLYANLQEQNNDSISSFVSSSKDKKRAKKKVPTSQENELFFKLINTLQSNYNSKFFTRNLEKINDVNMFVGGLSLLWIAVYSNRREAVLLLLKKGANPNKTSEKLQFPPLYVALELGFNNIVNILLNHPQIKLNACDKLGRSILMIAIAQKNMSVIDKIMTYLGTLEESAQKNIINKKNYKQDSILYLLVEFQYDKDCIQKLFEFKDENNNLLLDLNVVNMYHNTPLHAAIYTDNNEVTRLLVDNKAQLDLLNKRGLSPLHIATHKNNLNVVQLLLEKGANVNLQDPSLRTSLHISMEEYIGLEIIRLLLNYKIDTQIKANFEVDGVDKSYTALMLICCCYLNLEKVDLLLSFSKKKDLEDLQEAKVIASEDGHQEIVSKIEVKIKEFESSDLETSREESGL